MNDPSRTLYRDGGHVIEPEDFTRAELEKAEGAEPDLSDPLGIPPRCPQGRVMTDLIARENDIVTCIARNHPMFRVTRDVGRGERILAGQFEALHPEEADPVANTMMPHCRFCGSDFRTETGVHFEDGYH